MSARPSGTEPKIKFYINARTDAAKGLDAAKAESGKVCDAITADIKAMLAKA